MENRNVSLITDFYELTMASAYFAQNMHEKIAYFDVFFRNIPDNRWFCYICRFRTSNRIY